MDNVLNILQGILEAIGDFFKGLLGGITDIFSATDSTELIYTAIARWVFIFLAVLCCSNQFCPYCVRKILRKCGHICI